MTLFSGVSMSVVLVWRGLSEKNYAAAHDGNDDHNSVCDTMFVHVFFALR